ncbi:MAG: hypothetical protein IJM04_11880 [Prevotella sp.]|nr:hypothetical protein [Prevotella sp.]
MMSRRSLWMLIPLLVAFLSCGRKAETNFQEVKVQTRDYVAQGDSMLYGLACEGCNDSVIVLLPDSGGDPISFGILNARRNHKIFGRPSVGDKIAVMVNPESPGELLTAINLEQLIGTWVYMQMPEMHKGGEGLRRDSLLSLLTPEERSRIMAKIDSFMIPLEYGYTMKRDYTVSVVGGPPRKTSLDEHTPVIYPSIQRYKEWHVFNGRIIFSYGGVKVNNMNAGNTELRHDTVSLVLLRRDTMALQFADRVQGFKLKPDTLKEF